MVTQANTLRLAHTAKQTLWNVSLKINGHLMQIVLQRDATDVSYIMQNTAGWRLAHKHMVLQHTNLHFSH